MIALDGGGAPRHNIGHAVLRDNTMKHTARLPVMLTVALCMLAPAAWSTGDAGAPASDDAHAQKRAHMQEKWNNLPADQQSQMRDRMHEHARERYEQASPEEKEKMRQNMKERYDKASPEQKEKMRQHFKMRRELRRNKDTGGMQLPAAGQ